QALIIEADGTDKGVLLEEGLVGTEAFIALTNLDEENIMLAMYAKSLSKAKPITKVHRVSYDDIIDDLNIGSVIYPKYITAASIVRYVRAMHNSMGSNIETLYRMNDNKVEALEFIIKEDCPFIGKPLSEVELKDNVLICSINHKGNITIPQGSSVIQPGDTVVLVTTSEGVKDICDVVAK
ncbi:MAG: NAD-binding protein, partial [Lachnospiraceae bacterium]|nr:NAD-binding protein [Lachnospiraceae bacterium]